MNLKFLLMLMLLASTCLPQARAATTWVTIAEGDVNIIMPFTPTELFSAPTNVRLSPTDTWQTLSWDDVEHASKFEVQALNTEGNWETIIVTEELFLEITDDYADYTSFRVVACNYASCEGTGDFTASIRYIEVNNDIDITDTAFLPTLSSPEFIANTEGKAKVVNGSATYTVPIQLPTARNGFKPKINLSYNSRINSGNAGLGWNIGGLSQITRCAANFSVHAEEAQDSNKKYTIEDRLCYKGQALVKYNRLAAESDSDYWAEGSIYTTEMNSHVKIIARGNYSYNGVISPDYFEVKHKNGQTSFFGKHASDNGSRLHAMQIDNGHIKTWALDEAQDVYGNNYTVTYHNNVTNGEIYPAAIWYEPNSAVVFNYEEREGVYQWGFDRGEGEDYKYQRTKRLANITTYINADSDDPSSGSSILQYQLNYLVSEQTDRDLLTNITLCGFENVNETCAAPLEFEWQTGELGFKEGERPTNIDGEPVPIGRVIDFDQDGYNDLLGKYGSLHWGTDSNDFIEASYVKEAMPSGEKRVQIINTQQGQLLLIGAQGSLGTVTVNRDNDTATYNDLHTNNYTDEALNDFSTNAAIIIFDYNKDGLSDFLVENRLFVQQNDRTLTFDVYEFGLTTAPWSNDNNAMVENFAFDFTGDGTPDIASVYSDNLTTTNNEDDEDDRIHYRHHRMRIAKLDDDLQYTNLRSFYLNDINPAYNIPVPYSRYMIPGGIYKTLADINGDGRMDVLFHRKDWISGSTNRDAEISETGQWYVSFNGSGSRVPLGVNSGEVTNQFSHSYDFNKDGLADLLASEGNGDSYDQGCQIRVLQSSYDNGNETVIMKELGSDDTPLYLPITACIPLYVDRYANVFRGDLNNDGLVDLFVGGTEKFGNTTKVYYAKPKRPDLLTVVTNGFGAEVKFTYRNLTGELSNGKAIYTPSAVTFPEAQVNRNNQVVIKQQRSDGLGGYLASYYHYKGAKQNIQGRGYLGFEKIDVTSSEGITTSTLYRQDYPFIGLPYKKTSTDSLGNYIKVKEIDYQINPLNAQRTIIQSSTTREYNLTSDSLNSPYRVVKVSNTYDALGNIKETTQKVGTGLTANKVTGVLQTNTVTKTLTNDENNWVLGFVDYLTTTTTDGTTTKIINTDFTQYLHAGKPTLNAETTINFADTAISNTVTVSRNSYGIITATKIEADDGESGKITTRTNTLSGFDDKGMYPSTQTNAKQHQSTMLYDTRFGKIEGTIDANGLQHHISLGVFGEVLSSTNSNGTTTYISKYSCEGSSSVTCPEAATYFIATEIKHSKLTDTLGAPLTITYFDQLNREVRTETYTLSAQSTKVDTEYTATGNVYRVSEPFTGDTAENWTTFTEYDVLGRVRNMSLPSGGSVVTDYSQENGLLKKVSTTTIVNSNAGNSTQIKQIFTNALRQKIQVIDASNIAIDYTYDVLGNLHTTQVDSDQSTQITIKHDVAGNKIYMDDPDVGIIDYVYNGLGELRRQTWQQGTAHEKAIEYQYDQLGRKITRVDKPTTGTDITYTWAWDSRKKGLLDNKAGNGLVENYYYNSLSQLERQSTTIENNITRDFNFAYDDFGRQKTVNYPDGFNVQFEYHNAGVHVNTWDTTNSRKLLWALGSEIDSRGNLNYQLFGNGIGSKMTFNEETGQLAQITTGQLSGSNSTGLIGTVQQLAYDFDSIGNLQSRSSGIQGSSAVYSHERFEYDSLNRLTVSNTQWQGITGLNSARYRNFDYDNLGNLTYDSSLGSLTYAQTHNAGIHALTSANNQDYKYDKYGNAIKRGNQTIDYNTFNKPTNISGIRFNYDGDNKRFKQVNGDTTTYYFGHGRYEEVIAGNDEVSKKSYLSNYLLRTTNQQGVQLTFLHRDHLGSIEAMTDEYGNLIDTMSFDAWGNRQQANWTSGDPLMGTDYYPTTRGFTGHEMLDEVKLIHMNGRVYDPTVGRFLSADIFIQSPGNSQSYNRYSYVFNNPLSFVDPSGYTTERIEVTGPNRHNYNDYLREWSNNLADQYRSMMDRDSFAQGLVNTNSIQTQAMIMTLNNIIYTDDNGDIMILKGAADELFNDEEASKYEKRRIFLTKKYDNEDKFIEALGVEGKTVIVFGKRGLNYSPVTVSGPLSNLLNHEVLHEHAFVITSDGSLYNRGFNKSGLFSEDITWQGFGGSSYSFSGAYYVLPGNFNYQTFLNSIPGFLPSSNYTLGGTGVNNCQSYCSAVRSAIEGQ